MLFKVQQYSKDSSVTANTVAYFGFIVQCIHYPWYLIKLRLLENPQKKDLKSNPILCWKKDFKSQSNPHFKKDFKSNPIQNPILFINEIFKHIPYISNEQISFRKWSVPDFLLLKHMQLILTIFQQFWQFAIIIIVFGQDRHQPAKNKFGIFFSIDWLDKSKVPTKDY